MQVGAFVVGWFAYPLLIAAIADWIGLSKRFVPFIVARNWSAVIGIVPYFVPMLLFLAGAISLDTLGALTLLALAFNIYYAYLVARLAGGANMATAIGLVILDVALTLLIGASADRLIT